MSLMPEVQFLLSDPELGAHSFDITRREAKWVGGRLVVPQDNSTTQTIAAIGLIIPPTPEQLEFFPEGVRREDKKAIYSKTMMYVTEGKKISDTITWNSDTYKIIQVERWDEWGFCVAYAVKE